MLTMKKQFFVLWILCLIGTLSVLPLVEILQGTTVKPKYYFYALTQAGVLYGFIIFFGLKLAHNLHFQVFPEKFNRMNIFKDFLIGAFLAFILYTLDLYVFKLSEIVHFPNPALWLKLVASLYGAFNEEVLMRLFLVSLFVKIFSLVFKRDKSNFSIYLSIFLSAILFGVGHLPAMANITELTPLVVTRTLTLNGLAGIIFGWLYWRKSLLSAMLAHGTADVVLAFFP